jgi:hypothetical protein
MFLYSVCVKQLELAGWVCYLCEEKVAGIRPYSSNDDRSLLRPSRYNGQDGVSADVRMLAETPAQSPGYPSSLLRLGSDCPLALASHYHWRLVIQYV